MCTLEQVTDSQFLHLGNGGMDVHSVTVKIK